MPLSNATLYDYATSALVVLYFEYYVLFRIKRSLLHAWSNLNIVIDISIETKTNKKQQQKHEKEIREYISLSEFQF